MTRVPWRLPALLRPGRRLFVATLVAAFALAWWRDRRERFLPVVQMSGFLFWIGGLAVDVGTFKVSTWRERAPSDVAAKRQARLDPYEAAWLNGGAWRRVATAMAMQVRRGTAVIEPGLAQRRTAFGSWRLAALAVAQAVLVVVLMRLSHDLDSQNDDASVSDFCFAMLAVGWLAICAMPAGRLTATGAHSLKPYQQQANAASLRRAQALGEAPEASRAGLGARHPLDAMSVALLASSTVVDDPRFAAAWRLWPRQGCNDAWRGSGDVGSIPDDGSD